MTTAPTDQTRSHLQKVHEAAEADAGRYVRLQEDAISFDAQAHEDLGAGRTERAEHNERVAALIRKDMAALSDRVTSDLSSAYSIAAHATAWDDWTGWVEGAGGAAE